MRVLCAHGDRLGAAHRQHLYEHGPILQELRSLAAIVHFLFRGSSIWWSYKSRNPSRRSTTMSATAEVIEKPGKLSSISGDQWAHYQEHGYIIVRDLFTLQETAEMLAECEAIHRGEYGELYAG